ncbi:hypothetical protein [Arthrobacter sp. YN]|uniref:hypothetical protein n=1 Tax=Arthrobacter sp. YN TaxID=2020486 RepID=UPI0012FDA9A3|nr:hypothetical protein [Arthrobacter sp. YN]
MAQKALWTCPRAEGRALRDSRSIIFEMQSGDIVFHHATGLLRAVSQVANSYVDAQRPAGYRRRPGEKDSGWLVRVNPLRTDLALPYSELHRYIKPGRPGPLNTASNVYVGFLSRLTEADGLSLLCAPEINLPVTDDAVLGRGPNYWSEDESDATSFGKVRKEQRHLRMHLLAGRLIAPCSLCGNELPSGMLIAGHIKPRRFCSEAERWDFQAAAMLVCTLGCDALFEWGYLTVGSDGHVQEGRVAPTIGLAEAVSKVVGRSCSAHHELTAPYFEEHRRLTLEKTHKDSISTHLRGAHSERRQRSTQ